MPDLVNRQRPRHRLPADRGAAPAGATERGRASAEGKLPGRVLFWALNLVRGRDLKQPFDPAERMHARVKQEALNECLLCCAMGGTIDGVQGDHVLLAPPFIIEQAQLEELLHKLARALQRAPSTN